MIGSHNTLTYLRPKHWWMRPFTWIWRCQDVSFYMQLPFVDYFDIRVRFNKKGEIVFCHGLADLKTGIDGRSELDNILLAILSWKKKCRVLIERGDERNIMEILAPYLGHPVDCVMIKKEWRTLYGELPPMIDYCYVPFAADKPWWKQLKGVKISTPRRWAKKHNPVITEEMKKEETIHFMDFVKEDCK